MKKLLSSKEIPLDTLKFISDNRGIEVANFYEMLRKKHNQKKSPLYLNIVKEVSTLDDVITTLVCLLTQITLYSNKLDNKDSFLKEVRAEEITRVLNEYFKDKTMKGYADCPPAVAYNVGAALPYMDWAPRTLKEIISSNKE